MRNLLAASMLGVLTCVAVAARPVERASVDCPVCSVAARVAPRAPRASPTPVRRARAERAALHAPVSLRSPLLDIPSAELRAVGREFRIPTDTVLDEDTATLLGRTQEDRPR